MVNNGKKYFLGKNVTKDIEKAFALFSEAVNKD